MNQTEQTDYTSEVCRHIKNTHEKCKLEGWTFPGPPSFIHIPPDYTGSDLPFGSYRKQDNGRWLKVG